MSDTRRGRRRSEQRNLLYEESSLWGISIVVALVVVAFAMAMAIYFID